MHGGLSAGPKTEEGLARSRRARWIHGRYSEEAKAARIEAAERAEMEAWAKIEAERVFEEILGKRWMPTRRR